MPEGIVLSDEVVLVYVLRDSGVRGQLMSGRVERVGPRLAVFDRYGVAFEYLSGDRLRSWCIFKADGTALEGWREVLQVDISKIHSKL
jgi:hypothetical protein